MVDDVIVVRLEHSQKEYLRNYAESKGYVFRGRPNISEAIREIIDEKMSVRKVAEGERLESAQPRESDLISKAFALLNKGAKPWKVAEKIGDIELVEKCYRKRKEWMQVEQAEDLEKRRLRVESECYRLLSYVSAWKDYVNSELLNHLLLGIMVVCWSKTILPSEVIKETFGVSLDEFISKINREVEKIKSNPLLQLDPITRYMVVRELLDEWRERREERLDRMNPQPSAVKQIDVEQIDIERIMEKLNETFESRFEKYQSYIEEMIKRYL